MPSWVPDMVVSLLILGMTYALYSEGCFGAAVVTLNLIFSILIAFNFYEPLAKLIVENAGFMAGIADLVTLGGLFAVSFIAIKVLTENFSPTQVRLPALASFLGRAAFGLAGATIAAAFILILLDTAPVHKRPLGITYNHQPPFNLGIDRKLLAFVQYSTGTTFPSYNDANPDDSVYGRAKIFDPQGAWLVAHQNARPFGEGNVPEVQPGGGGSGGTPAGGSASP